MDLARNADVKTILNVTPFGEASAELSEKADIIIANEHEWSQLSATSDVSASMQARSLRHRQAIVVTRGSLGVCVASPDAYFELPASVIRPLDTVGAGDTFCGFPAAALDSGCRLKEASNLAVTAASLACLRVGVRRQCRRAVKPLTLCEMVW